MGTITKRLSKSGKPRFRAQVRIQREGLPIFTKSKTFSREVLAKEWMKNLEAQIEVNPDILSQPKNKVGQTLEEYIDKYLKEIKGQFNDKYELNLQRIAKYDICKKNVQQLTRHDFSQFAIDRRRGDVINMIQGVSPSTVLHDLSSISGVLSHAIFVWNEDIEHIQNEFQHALHGLKKSRIVTKSKSLERLPTSHELQILTNFFYQDWKRGRGTIPMHLIMWLAIYTGRRQDELCNLKLADFDRLNNQWLIRDVKNPDGSMGNHKYAHLEPYALLVIDALLNPKIRGRMLILGYSEELLVPVNAKTISSYFTRACKILDIKQLRFHDLRHESATRYAEDGFSIPQLQTITLHSSWKSLERYVNLKKRSDRLEFAQAMELAHYAYSKHQTSAISNMKPQRHINKVEIQEVNQALLIAKNPNTISTNFEFTQVQIENFINSFKPSKTVIDGFKNRSNLQNIFAWDNARQRFIAKYMQKAWEDYFVSQNCVDWTYLPSDTTHFNYSTLDAIKIKDNQVFKWNIQFDAWVDISAYYDLETKKVIMK